MFQTEGMALLKPRGTRSGGWASERWKEAVHSVAGGGQGRSRVGGEPQSVGNSGRMLNQQLDMIRFAF